MSEIYCQEYSTGDKLVFFYESYYLPGQDGINDGTKIRIDFSYNVKPDDPKLCIYLEDYLESKYLRWLGLDQIEYEYHRYMWSPDNPQWIDTNSGHVYDYHPAPYGNNQSITINFYTNIPIFSSKSDAEMYIDGYIPLSAAINYKKIMNNGSWTDIEKETKSTVLFIEEYQLLARRRMLIEKMNLLSKACAREFKVGDKPYYHCINNGYPSWWGTNVLLYVESFINPNFTLSSELQSKICFYFSDIGNLELYDERYLSIDSTFYFTDGHLEFAVDYGYGNKTENAPADFRAVGGNNDWRPTTLFMTNIPIFENRDLADQYYRGEIGVDKAFNKNKYYKNGTWVSV